MTAGGIGMSSHRQHCERVGALPVDIFMPIVQILIPLPEFYRYNEEQKMTELGRSSISDDFSNFSWSSVFPMTFAAAAI